MRWMPISGPPSWIRQTSTSRLASSYSETAKPTVTVNSATHRFHRMCIQTCTSQAAQLDHQGHNGVHQDSNSPDHLVLHPLHQAALQLSGLQDSPKSIHKASRHNSLMDAMTEVHNLSSNLFHHVSQAQDKSSKCVHTQDQSRLVMLAHLIVAHRLDHVTTILQALMLQAAPVARAVRLLVLSISSSNHQDLPSA